MLRTHQHSELFLMLMLVYYNIKNGGRAGFIYIWKLNSIYKASQRCVAFRPKFLSGLQGPTAFSKPARLCFCQRDPFLQECCLSLVTHRAHFHWRFFLNIRCGELHGPREVHLGFTGSFPWESELTRLKMKGFLRQLLRPCTDGRRKGRPASDICHIWSRKFNTPTPCFDWLRGDKEEDGVCEGWSDKPAQPKAAPWPVP